MLDACPYIVSESWNRRAIKTTNPSTVMVAVNSEVLKCTVAPIRSLWVLYHQRDRTQNVKYIRIEYSIIRHRWKRIMLDICNGNRKPCWNSAIVWCNDHYNKLFFNTGSVTECEVRFQAPSYKHTYMYTYGSIHWFYDTWYSTWTKSMRLWLLITE